MAPKVVAIGWLQNGYALKLVHDTGSARLIITL